MWRIDHTTSAPRLRVVVVVVKECACMAVRFERTDGLSEADASPITSRRRAERAHSVRSVVDPRAEVIRCHAP